MLELDSFNEEEDFNLDLQAFAIEWADTAHNDVDAADSEMIMNALYDIVSLVQQWPHKAGAQCVKSYENMMIDLATDNDKGIPIYLLAAIANSMRAGGVLSYSKEKGNKYVTLERADLPTATIIHLVTRDLG